MNCLKSMILFPGFHQFSFYGIRYLSAAPLKIMCCHIKVTSRQLWSESICVKSLNVIVNSRAYLSKPHKKKPVSNGINAKNAIFAIRTLGKFNFLLSSRDEQARCFLIFYHGTLCLCLPDPWFWRLDRCSNEFVRLCNG